MTKRQAQKVIQVAIVRASTEIAANSRGSHYAAGLASEGYVGGYRDALNDVILLLNGIIPTTRNYWESVPKETRRENQEEG